MKNCHKRVIGILGAGAVAFLAALSSYADMTGGAFRIIRDDVNSSGQVLEGGNYLLVGSLGGVDTRPVSGGNYTLTPGLPKIYYNPDAILNVSPMVVSTGEIDLTWTSPKGDVPAKTLPVYQAAKHGYIIKYSSATPLTGHAAFEAAVTSEIIPAASPTGSLESRSVMNLLANTSYYLSVKSFDTDWNGSEVSQATSCYTKAQIPAMRLDLFSYGKTSIQSVWDTNNQRPEVTVRFDAQVVFDTTTMDGLVTETVNSALGQAGYNFTSLFQGTDYWFRACSYNGANVFSGCSVWVTTQIPVGLPEALPFSGQAADRVTANWLPDGGIQAGWPTSGPSFEVYLSSDSAITNYYFDLPSPPARVTSQEFTGLLPNTTYYGKVRAYPEGGGHVGPFGTLNWTMTGVHATNSGTYAIFVDSASFTWTVPPVSNGPNLFYYRVEMSTAADFTGTVSSTTVDSTFLAADVTNLIPNTIYHARVVTLNNIGLPSAEGPCDLGIHTTRARAPIPVGFAGVTDYQIGMQWLANGNNALTHYEVDVTSEPSGNFGSGGFVSASTVTAAGASSFTFNTPLQLLANATYFAQIKAVAPTGGTDSVFVTFGSTVTHPTTAGSLAFSGLTTSSITVNWSNVNDNGLALNSLNDTMYRVELRKNVSPLTADFSASTTSLSQTFVNLSTNTTYYVQVFTQSRSVWPDSLSLPGAQSTLAAQPMAAAAPFSVVTSSSLTTYWTFGANPANTDYLVEISTNNFAFISASFQGTDVSSHTFTGLLGNSVYFARVWGINHGGLRNAPPALIIGSTVTLVNNPAFAGFQVFPSSITIFVDPQGNGPDTYYRFWDDNPPNATDIVPLQTDGIQSWHTMTGLPVNSSHTFHFVARNLANSETHPSVDVSTWTLASPDAYISVGQNEPTTLELNLYPGSNPPDSYNLGVNTQFAIQLAQVTPDGYPTQTGLFLGSSPGFSGSRQEFLPDSSTPVWRNLSQWNGGVILSSGLATGRKYFYQVLARNGSDGVVGPDIVTVCQLSFGMTMSGTPMLYLNGVNAYQSIGTDQASYIWTNQLKIPFIALGAFNNNLFLKSCNDYPGLCQDPTTPFPGFTTGNHATLTTFPGPFPGWNGRYDLSAPDQTSITMNPVYNYTDPLSGIRVPAEGEYYLHIIGDSYPFISSVTDPTYGHYTAQAMGQPFRIFVDTTPANPTAMKRAAFRCDDKGNVTYEIRDSTATGWRTPLFTWTDPDGNSPNAPAYNVSPTVGYSWSYSTDPSVTPSTTAIMIPASATTSLVIPSTSATYSVWEGPGLQPAGTYYFMVRSLDKAGNWSAPAVFHYICVPDLVQPRGTPDLYPSLGFAANTTLTTPSGVSVAVSTAGVMRLYFNKEMDSGTFTTSTVRLSLLNDNSGAYFGSNVPLGAISVLASVYGSTATIQPAAGVHLMPGCRYQLTTSTGLQDISGNPLEVQVSKRFYTLMDPSQRNVILGDALNAHGQPISQVVFNPVSWNGGFAGLAINEAPSTEPMAAPAIMGLIAKANKSLNQNAHGFGKPLAVHEFNLYDPSAVRMSGQFNQPVQLAMHYNDDDNDGIVDETKGTPNPVKVAALSIYWLDDQTGVWVRVPGSVVDSVNHTVTADVRHFSVYGLMGAPEMDLANAYAYPVPYKPSRHVNGIRFANVSDVVTIKIYTVNGDLVKTLHSESSGGEVTWNPVTNDAGSPVASDVYIYLIENAQQKKTGKLLVVR